MNTRWLIELEDWSRANGLVRLILCEAKLLTNRRPATNDHQAAARHIIRLCEAARLATNDRLLRSIEAQIRECVRRLDVQRVNWEQLVPNFRDPCLPKAVVLKPWVSPLEKGVVLVNYENQYVRLLRLPNLKEFAARYTLIVGPSWHPPHSLVNCVFAEAYPDTVFSLISNVKDLEILPRLSPKFVPLPLYGSSWVNTELYRPRPWEQRDIDILMVANWAKFKRHVALFKAMRRMPSSLRIVLVGQDQDGRTAETIRHEAAMYGVATRLQIMCDLAYPDIVDVYCRAKTTVILSRREGSCVAVAESLAADTPAAVLRDAMMGSRAFINPSTGRLLRHERLAEQLLDFLAEANAGRYSPRQWAEANISCFRSAAVMNDILRGHARGSGQQWTLDIAPVTWSPDPQLARPSDRTPIDPEREKIKREFGIELGKNRP